jgi:VIT1/CCC1 family predicted Fe2+/Mn2+ transporter
MSAEPAGGVPRRFVHRYLDPGERLGEILFGLIMVLTFTSTARVTLGAEEITARELLIAALGCNIAWGIIDGGMYIMSAMLDRARAARERAASLGGTVEKTRIHGDDLKGAVACAWLVIATTFPVALPFLIFDDALFAIRLSNALLVVMLFVVGYQWGKYANVNTWVAGTIFMVVGLILVAIAIALGG